MELPAALRHAVDQALDGIALVDLTLAAERLSQRYRAETRDGRFHLSDELAAQAYLTTRLPATYAAIRAAIAMTDEVLPDFAPRQQLDLGAGPGTALWAALDCWPHLQDALLLEGSAAIRNQGQRLLALAQGADTSLPRITLPNITWDDIDLAAAETLRARTETADLVTLCYVLDELAPEARHRLIDFAWSRCTGLLLIVEPGTPAGWHRILTARDQLLASRGTLIAPCPHERPCPLLPPDASAPQSSSGNWCHFSRRVARSRLHRLAKQADVPWEDEKFIFIAVAKPALAEGAARPTARVIAPARGSGGRVQLQLCTAAGDAEIRHVSKRDGDLYKRARRADWGDRFR